MNKKILLSGSVIIVAALGAFGIMSFQTNTTSQAAEKIEVQTTGPIDEKQQLQTADTQSAETNVLSDLFSAGSINAQMPWTPGDVNATAKALDQAAKVVSTAPQLEFTDSAKRVNMKLPVAWEARTMPGAQDKIVLTSFILEGPGAPPPTCVFTGVKSANTAKISQEKINEVMHSEKAVTGMKKAISGSGAKLVAVNKIKIDGQSALQLVIQPKVDKKSPDLTTDLIVLEQPGLRWQIACSSYTTEYDQIKPEYEAIVKSISWIK